MVIAGIAIGLVKDNGRYAILTDIAGLEDHFGDMDFKVAGTDKGITAIQLDLKISSISMDIVRQALDKARAARLEVLAKMKEAIPAPRPEISPYAPHIIYLFISPEKVGDVIGPAGKVIKKIIAATKAKIDVDETGKIIIASTDVEAAEKAKQMISEITVEAEVGKTYQGKIVRIEEYGAFVEILPSIVGLMHISEIAHHRIKSVRDVLKMGQIVNVKVLNIDEDNKIKLSMKALEEDTRSPQEREKDRERESYAKKNPPYRRPDRDRRNRF